MFTQLHPCVHCRVNPQTVTVRITKQQRRTVSDQGTAEERKSGVMSRLFEALHALGLGGQVDSFGHWVKVRGESCPVYVFEASRRSGYYTWCDDPSERTIEFYQDASDAIRAGLRLSATRRTTGTLGPATMQGSDAEPELAGREGEAVMRI